MGIINPFLGMTKYKRTAVAFMAGIRARRSKTALQCRHHSSVLDGTAQSAVARRLELSVPAGKGKPDLNLDIRVAAGLQCGGDTAKRWIRRLARLCLGRLQRSGLSTTPTLTHRDAAAARCAATAGWHFEFAGCNRLSHGDRRIRQRQLGKALARGCLRSIAPAARPARPGHGTSVEIPERFARRNVLNRHIRQKCLEPLGSVLHA